MVGTTLIIGIRQSVRYVLLCREHRVVEAYGFLADTGNVAGAVAVRTELQELDTVAFIRFAYYFYAHGVAEIPALEVWDFEEIHCVHIGKF